MQKTICESAQYNYCINITVYINGIQILKRHDDWIYSYDIDASDLIKKNLGLHKRVTDKTKDKYKLVVVLHAFRGTAWLKGKVPLKEAGGCFLN